MRRALARRGVRAADLDDTLQETFVTVYRRLPEFEGRSSLQTWLHAIAWRTASSYHKRSRRQRHPSPGIAAVHQASVFDASADFEAGEPAMDWATHDPELRDLLLLREVGELSISQLSSLTGLARATIRKRLENRSRLERRAARQTDVVFDPDATLEPAAAQHAPSLSSPPSRPRLLPGKQACAWTLGNLVINVRRGPTTAEALRAGGEVMEATLAAHPDGFRYLNVLEPSSMPPNREARQVNVELARRFGRKILAASFAVESPALKLLVVPILTSSFVLARIPVNVRFFDDVSTATAWLGRYGPVDPIRILASVATMRAHIDDACAD